MIKNQEIILATVGPAKDIVEKWTMDRDRFEQKSGVPWPIIYRASVRGIRSNVFEAIGIMWVAHEAEQGVPEIPYYGSRFPYWIYKWFKDNTPTVLGASQHCGMDENRFRSGLKMENAKTPTALWCAGAVLSRLCIREMPRSKWPTAGRAYLRAYEALKMGPKRIWSWPVACGGGSYDDPA
jgi:hypothetical protein